MGIRHDLWVDENDECKLAAFAILKRKKMAFLKTLKNISVPDGYSNMPRFKCMQKKKKSDLPVSTPQGTESVCLPTNLPPPIQYAPQLSRPVYSASHPIPMDQDTPHPGLTVWPESQPSRSVHLTSHLSPVGRDLLQPSRSVHSTSHLGLENQNSS
ncbi:hypothetical protein CQW23_28061 [Capsicum baccatum]|uniref:Uncharacterized protein n=1 Tax=Capsicum baccatum TaxID=33114 RepID=A0A2G2VFG9_CAPBA|nr:hypothetical protein CQW23_28061 [Capsicum baccatum]